MMEFNSYKQLLKFAKLFHKTALFPTLMSLPGKEEWMDVPGYELANSPNANPNQLVTLVEDNLLPEKKRSGESKRDEDRRIIDKWKLAGAALSNENYPQEKMGEMIERIGKMTDVGQIQILLMGIIDNPNTDPSKLELIRRRYNGKDKKYPNIFSVINAIEAKSKPRGRRVELPAEEMIKPVGMEVMEEEVA